ncbi:MAG: hypothetical protein KIS67_20110 [Verrucomicrobiae bacterium]|nr:hypothetical protein [Verrucomicrobiae bacterium]
MKKKPDPISDRTRALNAQIASLESEIKRLDAQLQSHPGQPRPRVASGSSREPGPRPPTHPPREPIFEEVNQTRLKTHAEPPNPPAHYNELGVRKYDFPAFLQRVRNFFRGPTTSNPKLVSYLAAGGVQGLRPLRKEKRVARNRFIAFSVVLFLVLLGIFWWFVRQH